MSGSAGCGRCNDEPAPGETCLVCGQSTPPTIDQIYTASDAQRREEIFLKVFTEYERMQFALRNIRNWSRFDEKDSIYKAALAGLGEE